MQANCGDLYDASRQSGVSLIFVRQWMKDDKDVAAQLIEAERVGAMALQSEAIRRAVIGEEKGVYYKGERVDTEIVKSDGLLTTLMKGRIPELFGKEAEAGNTFNGPTQINIMPRADNYEQWLAMKDATLTRRDTLDKTDANIIDVTAEPVPQLIDARDFVAAVMAPPSPFDGLGL